MRTLIIALLAAVTAGPGQAAAGEPSGKVPTLICNFDKAMGGALDSKSGWKWQMKANEPLGAMIFDSLDPKDGTGRTIANGGSSDVQVIANGRVLLIIEPLASGVVQTTHIYVALERNGKMPAVHSRHSYMGEVVIPSQHVGFCKIHG